MSESATKKRRVQDGDTPAVSVACIGGSGSLTHIAAEKFFESHNVAFRECKSMTAVADSIWSFDKPCSYGVIPVESSSGGVLNGVYEQLIAGSEMEIVAEFYQFDELCWCSKVEYTHKIQTVDECTCQNVKTW